MCVTLGKGMNGNCPHAEHLLNHDFLLSTRSGPLYFCISETAEWVPYDATTCPLVSKGVDVKSFPLDVGVMWLPCDDCEYLPPELFTLTRVSADLGDLDLGHLYDPSKDQAQTRTLRHSILESLIRTHVDVQRDRPSAEGQTAGVPDWGSQQAASDSLNEWQIVQSTLALTGQYEHGEGSLAASAAYSNTQEASQNPREFSPGQLEFLLREHIDHSTRGDFSVTDDYHEDRDGDTGGAAGGNTPGSRGC